MSGLIGDLLSTARALNAQTQGVNTAGKNMANVTNPAYSRQRVTLGDAGTIQTPNGPQSMGVQVLETTQIRDLLLDKQILRETSLLGSARAEEEALRWLQTNLGETVDRGSDSSFIDGASAVSLGASGVAQALQDFFNAFHGLSANPTSVSERQSVFQQASILVDRLNLTGNRLAELSSSLDESIVSETNVVNGILESIRSLNEQIVRIEISHPGSALDLRDKRQAKLEELSKLMDIEVATISDRPGQIEVSASGPGGASVMLVDGIRSVSTVSFDGTQFLAGATGSPLELTGGSLAGTLKARDGSLQNAISDFDRLSAQLVATVNSAYDPVSAGRNFFDPAGTTAVGFALNLGLDALSIRSTGTSEAGANEIALAVARAGERIHSTGAGDAIDGTLGDFHRQLISRVGGELASAGNRVSDQESVQKLLEGRRDSISGVSLDEEMADLLRFQRAFQASARVMRTIDEMLELVVTGLIR
ncbi:MAG: flagellar hook-associated protein FlgK [Verrucomicrobia bacterium]|nr:MAG: flagellar hook-associated protein FlgK [Verrucomicrobiota bacterium]